MAKGRFISRSVGHSREIAALPDDTTRMIFAFLLPYLDIEGRIDADPVYLNGICLSRLQMKNERLAKALVAMYEVGLIELYEEEGLPYLEYINFRKHQQGIRKEREIESLFPPPSGRFPAEFERYLSSALYQPEPKNDICVGDDAAITSQVVAEDAANTSQVVAEPSADTSEPSGTDDGISLSLSLSRSLSLSLSSSSKEPIGSLEEEGGLLEKGSTLETKKTPSSSPSENRLKNFGLLKAKLGPRRKRSPDEEDIDLVTECLAEDDSRDLWFDLPHARVQEAIRDSTAAFKKGAQFKTELIAELDKATRSLRASVRPASDTFDNLVQEWEQETGETYQE